MEITYDTTKNAQNIELRGLSFDRAAYFDFETALYIVDDRKNYGEIRHRGLGLLDGRVHSLVFIETQHGIRVISFRKANKREVKQYEQAIKT
jgi:uncharacterized protein